MAQLPATIYTAAQTRALDQTAIEAFGIPGATLMGRAGEAAFAELRARWPQARQIAIVCGGGNNGGDGFVLALAAHAAGLSPSLYMRVPLDKLSGDAADYARQSLDAGVDWQLVDDALAGVEDADVIVDALLGTGLSGPVRDDYRALIDAMNEAPAPVLAIDVPSGLHADTGQVQGAAVRAAVTITFIGLKQGLLTGQGPAVSGELLFDDLGVPQEVYQQVPAGGWRMTAADVAGLLPPRPRDAHKGQCGHVLVVGGDHGYAGAAIMAAQAALRCGAGLVSVATRVENAAVMVGRQPEVMARGVESVDQLLPLLEHASVIVAGPGLGRSAWGRTLLEKVLRAQLPRVLDADALNLLAESGVKVSMKDTVITPHPGEAARLLGTDIAAVQADRFASVRALQQRWHCTALLKGAGTLVCSDADAPVCLLDTGNPGMASGGMGDVLSGVIGALMAQGLAAANAAAAGAWLHGVAADDAVAGPGERGLLATDLLPFLRRRVNNPEAPQ